MRPGYRPQLRWLVLGPLLGALCGSLVAFVILLAGVVTEVSSPTEVLAALGPLATLAVIFGGTIGAFVGLLSGVPLGLLVGRHLPRRTARSRALVLGIVLPPVAMLAALSLLSGEVVLGGGSDWTGLAPFLGASLLGGPLAARAETRLLPHDDVS